MFQSTSVLDKPVGDEKVSARSLGYACEYAREELFDLVLRKCVEAGVTKATLARRLGKDPAQISRLLGASGNWTIDTFAELLFAIDGSLLTASALQPTLESNIKQQAEAGAGQIRVIFIRDHKLKVAAAKRQTHIISTKHRTENWSYSSCS